MNQTFKEYLNEVRYYRQKEDWQDDIDEHGASIGVCPKCGGIAKIRTEGPSLATARAFWECEDCGHNKTIQRY
ncbi:hypothetical protein LCGC14_2523860 [marine sediment metagenome]|uniref:Uncharacterized protein n=1 Tax=marine sediment metagenome TaxID=412755 RepID=A0A0F9DNV7_9ZZZZ